MYLLSIFALLKSIKSWLIQALSLFPHSIPPINQPTLKHHNNNNLILSNLSKYSINPSLNMSFSLTAELKDAGTKLSAEGKSPGMIGDLNRSEGEGMGTTSYHRTFNSQSEPSSATTSVKKPAGTSELKWSEALKSEKKFEEKMISVGDAAITKINQFDSKIGFSNKFNELDSKYHMTEKLDEIGRKVSDATVHFTRALSKGQIKHAFIHSMDAARVGECERRKHDRKLSLGAPQWIPESDSEGLVEGSRGAGPTPNDVFAEEERQLAAKESTA
jgi:hypothetical protein